MKNILTSIFNWFKNINVSKYDIIIAILIVVCGLCINKCNDNKNAVKDIEHAISLKDQEVKQWKDDSGRTHARIKELEADKSTINFLFKNKLDSVAKTLDIKAKQISEYTQIISSASGKGSGSLQYRDTGRLVLLPGEKVPVLIRDTLGSELKVDDGYLKFNALIKKDQSFDYHYIFNDSLNYTKYTKNTGFLGLKKESYIDIYSTNKNATITGIKQFRVSDIQKNKKFSLVLGPGIAWNGTNFIPSVNATFGIKLISF